MTLTEQNKLRWIYIACGLFIALNAVLVAFEFFYLPLLPAALFLVLLSLLSLDKLVLFIVFCTPLSVNLPDIGLGGVGMTLPTDPLLFGAMLLFFFKLLMEQKFDRNIMKHPLTIAITINLLWIGLSTITSEMPLVSLKYFLSRLWYVVTFYFIATQLFRNPDKINVYVWTFIISFTGIILYTIIHHSMYGFMEQPAHWVMSPFFNDHTSYGAILAMCYPFLIGTLFSPRVSRSFRIVIIPLVALFTLALILSYTRAAWVSLIFALGVFLTMKLKIKFRTVFIISLVFFGLLGALREQIIMKLEKNRQDSSADLAEHVQSISNITSDASNLERLNRWSSAFRMFEEKPFLGWGPGTYMFKYAPYQSSQEITPISTNAGNKGNAHSEYIGPLSESGLFGAVSFLLIVILSSYTAIKLYSRLEDKAMKFYVMSLLLGLMTYFIHGMLNNFLDTDKASAPFWGFMAAIVTIDVYHRKHQSQVSANPAQPEQPQPDLK